MGGTTDGRLLARFTFHPLAKFGSILLGRRRIAVKLKSADDYVGRPKSLKLRTSAKNVNLMKLEKVAINDVLPLKTARDAIAFSTSHLLGLQILAANEPNAISFRVTVGRHVNAA